MHAQRPDPRQEADRAILQEHGDALGRVCMAFLGEVAAAQAAVEETFALAFEALPRKEDGPLRGWLFGLARATCARKLETDTASHDPQAESGLATRARAALRGLKPTERDAVVLRWGGRLPLEEIAQACRVDQATARARLNKGLARLRASLENEA